MKLAPLSMEEIKQVWRMLERKDRIRVYILTLAQIFAALIDILTLSLLGALTSFVVQGISGKTPDLLTSPYLVSLNLTSVTFYELTFILVGLLLTLLILRTGFSIFLNKKMMRFIARRGAFITETLIKRLLSKELTFVNKKTSQESLFALTGAVDRLVNGVIGSTSQIIVDASIILVFLITLFFVDPLITSLVLFYFLLVAISLYLIFSSRIRSLGLLESRLSVSVNSLILEVLGAYREIYVTGRQTYYASRIKQQRLANAELVSQKLILPMVNRFVFELASIVSLILIASMLFLRKDAIAAVSTLTVFLLASARVAPLILKVQQNMLSIRNGLAVGAPALELSNDMIKAPQNSMEFSSFGASDSKDLILKCENISFSYSDSERMVLNNLDFRLNEGEIVAVIGSSGAGKSSFLDLVIGVNKVTSGTIWRRQFPTKNSIEDRKQGIGYVPQTPMIIEGTVRQNLVIGYDEDSFDEEELNLALYFACLDSKTFEARSFLDHRIGERGNKISGGERQRISIARALLFKPKLLVLDEGTSALDYKTEKKIFERLREIKQLTVLMTAHKSSTLRYADKIYELRNGKMTQIKIQQP